MADSEHNSMDTVTFNLRMNTERLKRLKMLVVGGMLNTDELTIVDKLEILTATVVGLTVDHAHLLAQNLELQERLDKLYARFN